MLKIEDTLEVMLAAKQLVESYEIAQKTGKAIAEPLILAQLGNVSEALEGVREKYRLEIAWKKRGMMQRKAVA